MIYKQLKNSEAVRTKGGKELVVQIDSEGIDERLEVGMTAAFSAVMVDEVIFADMVSYSLRGIGQAEYHKKTRAFVMKCPFKSVEKATLSGDFFDRLKPPCCISARRFVIYFGIFFIAYSQTTKSLTNPQ